MSKPVILTGLRANNDLHIGNYFGALLPIIDMARKHADEYEINLFVPDLHSFTTPIDHSKLYEQTMHNLKLFVAAGLPLDHDNIYIYRQSFIPAHTELTVILNSFTYFGEMRRMTQFKDKTQRAKESLVNVLYGEKNDEPGKKNEVQLTEKELSTLINVVDKSDEPMGSVGLFDYPVLMAADILLYGAKYVPVGDDQTQHVEFARDIAERMNSKFGDLFVVPEPVKKQHEFFGKDQGLRIKDLADPTKKMSKSDASDKGLIFLGDNPEEAAKKVMSATTDSEGKVAFDFEKQPGVTNLLQILSLLSGKSQGEVNREQEGKTSYGELKSAVAEAVKDFLTESQAKFAQVDEQALLAKLEQDEAAMNKVANAKLLEVQKAVGLRPQSS